jgi:hypothetical protein
VKDLCKAQNPGWLCLTLSGQPQLKKKWKGYALEGLPGRVTGRELSHKLMKGVDNRLLLPGAPSLGRQDPFPAVENPGLTT